VNVSILIADDQPLMRAALRMSLEAEPGFDVVGDASDGLEAVELAERLRPDVVVMDIRMPNLDGVAATRRLTARPNGESVKVLVITTFDLDDYVVEALRAGASGFLLKDATAEELIHAVRVIADGNALLAPSVTKRLLDRYAHRLPPSAPPRSDAILNLTNREHQVFALVTRGFSNSAIAQELHLAESSVKTHVSHLLSKLGLVDRVQLVVFAYENGHIQPGTI
jgi:DNA-binding NarL/FixJ family response regulator